MKLVVLGAAESGVGAAILAQHKGYEVFVSDRGTIRSHYKSLLDAHGLPWEEGTHTAERILDADEVVKSPGIPDDAPMVKALTEKGIPVISELEFAARYTQAKLLCITGSNGKTTTTSLIYHILREAGYNVELAGNIGRSMALRVAENDEKGDPDWFVLEISSFQLDNMYDFRANIAVLLNITPDHLDRYGYVMQRYVESKMRIIRNQQPEDYFVYWADDEYIPTELARHAHLAQPLPFADRQRSGLAAYGSGVEGDDSYGFGEGARLVVEQPRAFSQLLSQLSLPGKHNLRNCQAAALATLAAGVDVETLARCLSDFPGVEHRLERVGNFDGVNYINDSKATNVSSTYYALRTMTTPYVLILGGEDKGNDYMDITELITSGARGLVFLTTDVLKLYKSFHGKVPQIASALSMEEAIAHAREMAQPGDTVLLSPACASFDLFTSYIHRGDRFREVVQGLIQAEEKHA